MTLDNQNGMTKIPLNSAIICYESARKEMMLRIRERELAFYAWVAGLGTILTLTFHNSPPEIRLLLLLPLLSFGISFRIAQHEILIAALAKYCKDEVGPFLKAELPSMLKHWDESNALSHVQSSIIKYRALVNVLLMGVPSGYAIVVNESKCLESTDWALIWYLSIVLTVATIWFLGYSFLNRLRNAMGQSGGEHR